MRNPDRLNSLYDTFKEVHKEYFPDLRFGQLMSNFFGWCASERSSLEILFFVEDDKWEKWFREYAEEIGSWKRD